MAVPILSGLEWSQIRHAYEVPGANVSAVACRYGISHSVIRKQANTRGWTKGEPLSSDTDEEHDTVAEPRLKAIVANIRPANTRQGDDVSFIADHTGSFVASLI
jgi:transposase-like protein